MSRNNGSLHMFSIFIAYFVNIFFVKGGLLKLCFFFVDIKEHYFKCCVSRCPIFILSSSKNCLPHQNSVWNINYQKCNQKVFYCLHTNKNTRLPPCLFTSDRAFIDQWRKEWFFILYKQLGKYKMAYRKEYKNREM